MAGTSQATLKATPGDESASKTPRNPSLLDWRTGPGSVPTDPESCGKSVYRGHRSDDGLWHVRGYHKSCGRSDCPTCHRQVAKKLAVKAADRLTAAMPLSHTEEQQPLPRNWFIIDPGPNTRPCGGGVDWWRDRRTYEAVRKRMGAILAGAGIVAWLAIPHCDDDGDGCPYRMHWHVMGDGNFDRRFLKDQGWFSKRDLVPAAWETRRDPNENTSPVDWLSTTLSSRSSYPYRRSIQRLTYGGLANAAAQAARLTPEQRAALREVRRLCRRGPESVECPVCHAPVARNDWFIAQSERGFECPEGFGCVADLSEWSFWRPEEIGYGPPILVPAN